MITNRSIAGAAVAGILLTSPTLVAVAEPAHAVSAPYENAALPIPQRVADLLARMKLSEKVGQMTQAERASIDSDPSIIASDNLGSLLSGGGSVPTPNTPTAWADMVDRYQSAALKSRLHIPILYGVDTVHGDGNMYGATVFPHNIGLGATRDPALVARVEHVAASETRSTGPQWVFAPCICVARRPVGPYVRVVRGGPRVGRADGDRDRRVPGRPGAAQPQRPGPGHGEALRW